MSTFSEWTVGGIFYSTLILAETFGKSNTGRIVDLNPNEGNPYTPAYAIYENNALSKVALFNYVDDPSGASDLSVTIALPAGAPANIRVKWVVLLINLFSTTDRDFQIPCRRFRCPEAKHQLGWADIWKPVPGGWTPQGRSEHCVNQL